MRFPYGDSKAAKGHEARILEGRGGGFGGGDVGGYGDVEGEVRSEGVGLVAVGRGRRTGPVGRMEA